MSYSLLHNIHVYCISPVQFTFKVWYLTPWGVVEMVVCNNGGWWTRGLICQDMPTLKVLFLGTVRGKVGEGISENLGSYKCPNITDVKTTWPASSSDFLICIRYSEYSSVIPVYCNLTNFSCPRWCCSFLHLAYLIQFLVRQFYDERSQIGRVYVQSSCSLLSRPKLQLVQASVHSS